MAKLSISVPDSVLAQLDKVHPDWDSLGMSHKITAVIESYLWSKKAPQVYLCRDGQYRTLSELRDYESEHSK